MKNFIKLLLVVLFVVSSLVAGDIATVTALNGGAYIDRGGEKIDVSLGMKLQEKDRIITDDKAKVQIIFNDETIITLGKNSNFSIKEYLFEDKKEPIAKFSMLRGAMRTISGKIGKVAPKRFSVATKTATIGIRGTNFTVLVGDDGVQNVFCTHGAISVTFRGEQHIIREGFYIAISPEGKINVKEFKPQELKNMRSKAFVKSKAKEETKGLMPQGQIDTTKTENVEVEVKDLDNQTRDTTQISNGEKEALNLFKPLDIYIGYALENNKDSSLYAIYMLFHEPEGEEYDSQDTDMKLPIGSLFGDAGEYKLDLWIVNNDIKGKFVDILFRDDNDKLDSLDNNPDKNYLRTLENGVESNYVRWGDWAVKYDRSNYGEIFHEEKQGFWVAGQMTDASVVDSMKGTYTYSGSYKGIDYSNNKEIVHGDASMDVNFDLDEVNLNVAGSSFHMTIDGNVFSDRDNGSAEGMFYGPNAEAAGGEFLTHDDENNPKVKGVYEVKR